MFSAHILTTCYCKHIFTNPMIQCTLRGCLHSKQCISSSLKHDIVIRVINLYCIMGMGKKSVINKKDLKRVQGWRSGESTRLASIWPLGEAFLDAVNNHLVFTLVEMSIYK